MGWELKWEGRATDFVPDLLEAAGHPGAVAFLAKEALWEAVQSAGERNPSAWVEVKAQGIENKEEPGSGKVTIMMEVREDAPDKPMDKVQEQLRRQQPISLLDRREHASASEPAGSYPREGSSHTGAED